MALDLADRLFPRRGRILTRTPTPTGILCTMTIIDMPEDPEASATDPKGCKLLTNGVTGMAS